MGSKSEKREALDYFYLFAALTGINAAAHIMTLVGYRLEIITSVVTLSLNLRIIALVIAIVLLFRLKAYNVEDIKNGSKKSGGLIFIINLLLLVYAFVITRKMGESIASTSALNMLFFSVPMTVAWTSDKLLKNDRQSDWLKEVGSYDENVDKRNFFWRFKLDFTHLDRTISRKDLLETYSNWFLINMVFFVIALVSISQSFESYSEITLIFLTIFFSRPLLFIFDVIFNLSASLEGECIGFYEHRSRSNSQRYYYSYIVTNYKRKVEVKFTTDKLQFFQEGEYVKIYYTLLSRKLLKSHELSYFEDN